MKTLFNLAVIVACVVLSSFAAYAKTTVVWWDYLGGGDGVRIKSLIKQFNKENPDIQIKETTLGWGTPYYDKVQAAAASGQGPDVMLYHESRLPIGILSGALRPFSDDELKSAGVAPADYSPSTWQGMQSDGKQYAIPFDVDSIVLYYNKTLLKKAGLLDANGLPQGLDGAGNFDAALKKLSAGGHISLSFPSADGSTAWRIFYTLLAQQGGEFITDGKVLDGDNAMKATQALTEMAQWVSAEGATKMRSYPASIGDFTSGKAAFHINGVWEVPTMADLAKKKKLGFEWGAIQMPTIFAQPGTWGDADGFAIPDRKGHEIAPDK
ncbi:MAG: extracellular solute-binding protein, partial [Devosia sp.]